MRDRLNFRVVGSSYLGEGSNLMVQLAEENMLLDLIPEPENVHDTSAVGVWLMGTKIGYLPKYVSSLLTPNHLKEGEYSAIIKEIHYGQKDPISAVLILMEGI